MHVHFFAIPVHDSQIETDNLNRLLACERILSVDREFVANGANSFWSICVLSQPNKSPESNDFPKKKVIDYREVLNAEDFQIYAQLRTLRKELATHEAVPVYSVFTNEQLAKIAQSRMTTKTAIKSISGVGDARVEKYAAAFIELMIKLTHDKDVPSDES